MSEKRVWFLTALGVAVVISAAAFAHARSTGELSQKEARRLIAHLAGIDLSTDAVRIKEISPLGSSAVVVAQVETAFRFVKGDAGAWRPVELRTGNNRWEDLDLIMRAVNSEKTERARAELETVAVALEAFRRERGFYVVAESEAVLVDHLSPKYLPRVIRLDPWHRPYLYQGDRDHFLLRSAGLDGKPGTGDDIVVSERRAGRS